MQKSKRAESIPRTRFNGSSTPDKMMSGANISEESRRLKFVNREDSESSRAKSKLTKVDKARNQGVRIFINKSTIHANEDNDDGKPKLSDRSASQRKVIEINEHSRGILDSARSVDEHSKLNDEQRKYKPQT